MGSNVQRGMWPCVTHVTKRIVEEGTGGWVGMLGGGGGVG